MHASCVAAARVTRSPTRSPWRRVRQRRIGVAGRVRPCASPGRITVSNCEALRLVHRHHRDARRPRRRAARAARRRARRRTRRGREVAAARVLADEREHRVDRLEVDRVVERRRAAEREPGAADAIGAAAAAARPRARARRRRARASRGGAVGRERRRASTPSSIAREAARRRRARSRRGPRASSPAIGERSSASHASRSSGCRIACSSDTASRTAERSASASRSTAE